MVFACLTHDPPLFQTIVSSPPETMSVVEVKERLLLLQALAGYAGLAHFIGAFHAPNGGRDMSAHYALLGVSRRRIMCVSLLFRLLHLCGEVLSFHWWGF